MRFAPISRVVLIALAIAGAAAIVPARAADVATDCAGDLKRFCAHEVSGDQVRCLKKNQASLLPACKRSLSAQAKSAARLCAAEIEQFLTTSFLFLSGISKSISGYESLSGFKNLSKIKPCFIESISVMPRI